MASQSTCRTGVAWTGLRKDYPIRRTSPSIISQSVPADAVNISILVTVVCCGMTVIIFLALGALQNIQAQRRWTANGFERLL